MKTILFALLMVLGLGANAQVTKVTLQASGLTCSMCSKAVLNALKQVPSVNDVRVDIKNQQYHISFKEGAEIDFDALSKAVEDAGFSVATLEVTANLEQVKLNKDEHIKIGGVYFHFLNGNGQELNGTTSFTLVDKSFTTAKKHKKYSAMSKKECVQTGRMAKCCTKDESAEGTRVYHAII